MVHISSSLDKLMTMSGVDRSVPKSEPPEINPSPPSLDDLRAECQRECDLWNVGKGKMGGEDCPVCLNRGYVFRPVFEKMYHDFVPTAFDCECKASRISRARLKRSGAGPLMARCSLENYDTSSGDWQRSIAYLAKEYLGDAHTGAWFYIGGDAGSGKSHICAAIMRKILDMGIPCTWMDWVDEATKITRGRWDSYDELMKPWVQAKTLVIDDFLKCLGTAKPTPADMKIAYSIINYRYSRPELITIFSSEHTLDRVIEFDPATGTRIDHRCVSKYIIDNSYSGARNVRHMYDFRDESAIESLFGV